MSFLYPLGLLGLIGIPILVLIYIIKSKYAEQTVASTYLWTLSERFLKRKRPVSPLSGIISLLLQCLSVLLISLVIAHPVITVPDAAKEYCFIIDASGSMNTVRDGKTRLEYGKEEILEIVDASSDGSIYSVIYVSDVTSTVLDRSESKKEVREYLAELSAGYVSADYTSAVAKAAEYFGENPSLITYLVTDTEYNETENIRLINVSGGESNAAISDISWDIVGGELTVNGILTAHGMGGDFHISVFADGASDAVSELSVAAEAGERVPFSATARLKTFNSLTVTLAGDDGLLLDNRRMIFDIESEDSHSILLVTETPFFFSTVLQALGHTKLTVMTPDEYDSSVGGFGLYIFDCCTPTSAPTDGAVWYIDPQGSIPDTGFSVQGEVLLSRGEEIEMTSSTSSAARAMTEGLEGTGIEILEYMRCSLYRSFTTLFSYAGSPLVFAGVGPGGHREVVFAFDLHNSNLPLLVDFILLADNLMHYSFPDVIERTDYFAGDDAAINVVANCSSIRVDAPSGEVTYLNVDSAVTSFALTEVGEYKITVTVSKIPTTYYIYSALPDAESEPSPTLDYIGFTGTAEEGGFDGTFDPVYIFFILLAIIFIADWTVYCYEKYQLR
ncbi:MAG: BatA and WFA domain-containing protein [Clostridia bacterium]|nr:BatA and WFA domain-containing protein [Clostridia bacterium]